MNRNMNQSFDHVAGTPVGHGQPMPTVEGSGTDPPPEGVFVISLTANQLDALLPKVVDSALASKNPKADTFPRKP